MSGRLSSPAPGRSVGAPPTAQVSIDPVSEHLAVAGRRGFAVLSLRTSRWRLFGDVGQEQDLATLALHLCDA